MDQQLTQMLTQILIRMYLIIPKIIITPWNFIIRRNVGYRYVSDIGAIFGLLVIIGMSILGYTISVSVRHVSYSTTWIDLILAFALPLLFGYNIWITRHEWWKSIKAGNMIHTRFHGEFTFVPSTHYSHIVLMPIIMVVASFFAIFISKVLFIYLFFAGLSLSSEGQIYFWLMRRKFFDQIDAQVESQTQITVDDVNPESREKPKKDQKPLSIKAKTDLAHWQPPFPAYQEKAPDVEELMKEKK